MLYDKLVNNKQKTKMNERFGSTTVLTDGKTLVSFIKHTARQDHKNEISAGWLLASYLVLFLMLLIDNVLILW